jgi:GTPase
LNFAPTFFQEKAASKKYISSRLCSNNILDINCIQKTKKDITPMLPIVAIIGRPNVGKSTLFNRVIGQRKAVTADFAGTTRDRLYSEAAWNGTDFVLVDTAGIEVGNELTPSYKHLDEDVQEQVLLAIDEADVLLFVVDVTTGPTEQDMRAMKIIHKSKKPFVIAANKYDSEKYFSNISELYQLGAELIIPVAALTGRGTGDLLDAVVVAARKVKPTKQINLEDKEGIAVAITGRPNVGKSSLFNAILGQKLAVVSDIAGTTRDFTISTLTSDKGIINFIDTAGIRRRGKVGKVLGSRPEGQIERYSVLRSFRAVENAEIVLILIDPTEGLTAQDLHIAGFARDQHKGIIIVVNKWDAVEEDEKDMQKYLAYLHAKISFLAYAPVIFVSAKTGKNLNKLPDVIFEIAENRARRIPTAELNLLLGDDILKTSPKAVKGKLPKINYITQADINPPTFIFFANFPELIHFSYKRFLENRIRARWNFEGAAVNIVVKRKNIAYTYDKKKKK